MFVNEVALLFPVTFSDLYLSFLKGQGHQGIFSFCKEEIVLEHFKGTKATNRGHRGLGPLPFIIIVYRPH